jgi:hypothetical protein
MSTDTVIRVVDVARLSKSTSQIASVEVLAGEPLLNMKLISPESPGSWQIVGFATMPASFALLHPNAMNLNIANLDDKGELRDGIVLTESK